MGGPRLRPEIESLPAYKAGQAPIERTDITTFKISSNESPFEPPDRVREAIERAARQVHRYPDPFSRRLVAALAQRFDVASDQIALGTGSVAVVGQLLWAAAGPGDSVVYPWRSFEAYPIWVQMTGARSVQVPLLSNERHDLDAMSAAIDETTRVIFVCNPNNPTGTLVREAAVRELMDTIPEHVLVVFDEAYAELALGPMPDTLAYVRNARPCIVLRTFSKAYGLAGLRLGYGVGPAPLVTALQKARQPFNTNRLAQEAALAALDDEPFVNRSRQLFREAKKYLEQRCTALGLDYEPTFANFLLIRVGDGAAVAAELMRRGVIVRPMAGYGLPEHIRVSFGTMPENRRFIEALQAALDDKPADD